VLCNVLIVCLFIAVVAVYRKVERGFVYFPHCLSVVCENFHFPDIFALSWPRISSIFDIGASLLDGISSC